jgi:RNA polymerase sigma-70 factor (ECF subfamily)
MELDVHPDPNELLQSARKLDPQALAAIYDLHSPALFRYAMRRLGDVSLAEDCLSETFSRFLQALHSGRGPRDHLQAYLYRIAHNWIVDHYRRGPDPAEELTERDQDDGPDPEEQAAQRLRQERLRTSLRKLTPDQQQVIALKFLEGWGNQEIAQAMRKTVGSIKSLQHRALAALQRDLEEEDLL